MSAENDNSTTPVRLTPTTGTPTSGEAHVVVSTPSSAVAGLYSTSMIEKEEQEAKERYRKLIRVAERRISNGRLFAESTVESSIQQEIADHDVLTLTQLKALLPEFFIAPCLVISELMSEDDAPEMLFFLISAIKKEVDTYVA